MSWVVEPEKEKIKVIYNDEEIDQIDRNVSIEEFIERIKAIAKGLGISRFNVYDDRGNEVLPTPENINRVLEVANSITIVKADTAG